MSEYVKSVCTGCYRDCTVIHRWSAGTPTDCPYGIPCNVDFNDLPDEEEE